MSRTTVYAVVHATGQECLDHELDTLIDSIWFDEGDARARLQQLADAIAKPGTGRVAVVDDEGQVIEVIDTAHVIRFFLNLLEVQ